VKKPKGKELTTQEKEYNREVSSFRVRVEHAIGGAKRIKTLSYEVNIQGLVLCEERQCQTQRQPAIDVPSANTSGSFCPISITGRIYHSKN